MQVAIVIPFFQRKPGLLQRAVRSIFENTELAAGHSFQLLVVDDASPVTAESELALLQIESRNTQTRVIRQQNAGPGKARNTGLNSLDRGTDVVVFLDSDDTWSPEHLQRICLAFSQGIDFYFSDHLRTGEPLTRFQECALLGGRASSVAEGLFEYTGDLFSATLAKSPIGTSTVAYRYSKYPDIRFHEKIRAGEDIMFWLDIASRQPKVLYSTQVEAHYGSGVNIFHGVQWGTTSDLKRLRDSTIFHQTVVTRFPLKAADHSNNAKRLVELEKSFANSFLGAIKHREKNVGAVFWGYLRLQPSFIWRLPQQLLALLR